ncbi:MAG: c-type cytochrome [Candidatus Nitrospinota bacterium M3_3B_026]
MIRKRISTALLAGIAAGAVLIAGLASPAHAESAADNYKLFCWQCHGSAGTGKGINAPHLAVQPRNHTSAKDMGELTEETVFKAIKLGGPAVGKSAQMPPWGGVMTDDEIKEMVSYLFELCKCEPKKK